MACIIDSWLPTASTIECAPSPAGELPGRRHALIAAFGEDVGRAELAGQLLPGLVPAHRDDLFGAQLPGREDG
jgi:hypothetical protein